ncbi:MAG: hypothetical protein IJ526_01880 [Lachnospiraceae bacterium]|nr:hypothetical protein [Lachnospiraceae bacterium]
MAIAGLATYQSFSMNYSVRRDSKDSDSGDGGSFMNQMLTFHKKDTATVQDKDGKYVSADKEAASELRFGGIQGMSPVGKYGELKPYTRCITANIKTKEMTASEADGQMIYSYQEEERSFNIFINCDGENKTYTIKGMDENGQEIEEEFDPYNLDPEMMDFPEFSALCMYIRQTDETADLMTKMAFADASYFDGIFEKGDRVPMLKDYAQEYQDVAPSLAKLASQLFDAINDFFDKTAWNRGLSGDGINMLFEDKEADSIGKSDEPIRESVITRHTEYKDPETDKKVPVDIRYTTSYSDSGISCTERSDVGWKVSERSLWTLEYDNPESYSKVQDFLKSFSEDQKLTFATQEKFWKDFMQEDFDIQGFRAFYETTDNGRIDVEKALAEGKSMRETLTEPNAEYFNNQSFIGHVWTEQEMWDNWYARIDASQRAARANGSGIEPPTETITTTNSKTRAYRDQAFHYIGSRAPERVKQAWLDAADEIGIDGQGISDFGTLDHIPQFMMQRFIRQYNGYEVDDVLGSSVSSAIKAAQDAIYAIDHPLEPNSTRSADVLKKREQERAFYERFIEKLRA